MSHKPAAPNFPVPPAKTVEEVFTPKLEGLIKAWVAKYPEDQAQSAVIPVLTFVQEANGGWLTEELMNAVADRLGMPKIAVYEVATFYSLFELSPVGRNKVHVCTNLSCMLRGSEKIMAHLKQKLGVEPGCTTPDGRILLKEVECLGACVGAPMMQVNKTYHENLTPESVDEIIDGLK